MMNSNISYKKDSAIIGLMIKFVRNKRHLSQQETAKMAGINRALISHVENGNMEKSVLKPVSLLFDALRINTNSLFNPSLYDLIKIEKNNKIEIVLTEEYSEMSDSIMKIYSAIFDAYCAILPWSVNLDIAKKTKEYEDLISSPLVEEALKLKSKIHKGKTNEKYAVHIDVLDHLPSYIILELLMSFSKKDLLDIFWGSETKDNKIFSDILSRDPFPIFMKKIGPKWTKLEDYIDEEIKKLQNDPSLKKYENEIQSLNYLFDNKYDTLRNCLRHKDFLNLIQDKKSLLFQYIEFSDGVMSAVTKINRLKKLCKSTKQPITSNGNNGASKLQDLFNKTYERYPLLGVLNNCYGSLTEHKNHFAIYVNAVDEQ